MLVTSEKCNPKSLQHLLKLGADPSLTFECGNSLYHYVRDKAGVEIVFDSGFENLNRPNSEGASPLMQAVKSHIEGLSRAMIKRGADVNQQDKQGATALHIACRANSLCFDFPDGNYFLKQISRRIVETTILLHYGADPLLRDNCRCHCSKGGCSPSTLLLSPKRPESPGDPWVMEWLLMVKEYKSEFIAKQAFLDLVKMKQFEKLGITHLCCHRTRSRSSPDVMDEEEIDEILDEERYLIRELEDFMGKYAESLVSPVEEAWIKILPDRFVPLKAWVQKYWNLITWKGPWMSGRMHDRDPAPGRVPENIGPEKRRLYIDKSSDAFEHVWGPHMIRRLSETELYTVWVDHYYQHSQNYDDPRTIDEQWYKTRKRWAIRQAEVLEAVNIKDVAEEDS